MKTAERHQPADIVVAAADHIGRMVDDHLLDAAPARFLEHEEEFGHRQVTAGQDDVGFCDQIEHLLGRVADLPVRIERAERNRIEHFLRGLWEGLRLPGRLLDVVLGRQGRHPYDLGAELGGMIDGVRD